MATIFKLIIEDDEGKTTVYPLADGQVSIGRKESNTIRLMERNVSRRHARLVRNTGSVFIEDLDSYNGIRINGERIAGRYEVREGDLVEIGDYHLALQRTEVAEEAGGRSGDGWPQAGTVPDIRLPNEMGVAAGRDTLIDQQAPPAASAFTQTVEQGALDQPLPPSQPLVEPPSQGNAGGSGPVPPFPGAGAGVPNNPMYGEASRATEAISTPEKLAVGPAYESAVPRLVCVSTTYAGKEFALTRPELIIGRVEDNDIVIEHRSVSRNHAKVLFDGSTHKIIDLQSANGILVNGEEYAMTDLRKGDLVELGHVRFRFIPADEPFIATEEEIKEMREAGVAAPEAPKKSPSNGMGLVAPAAPAGRDAPLPAYDPSTAATVTDTPLDALGMGDLAAPQIHVSPVAAAETVPNSVARAPRSVSDQGATQVNAMPASPSAAAFSATVPNTPRQASPAPRASTRLDSEIDPPEEQGAKKGLLIAIAALLLAAIVLAILVLMGGGSSERQEALQKAFAAKDWTKVVQMYEEDPSDFEDPKAVLPLYKKASEAMRNPRTALPPPPPEPELEPDEPPAPDPEPLEPVREPEPEVELPVGDAVAPKAKARATKKRPRPRRRSKSAAIAKLAADGTTALINGDLTQAERMLTKCIKADAPLPVCHRTLGVLYAQRDDTRRSLYHYRKYVELAPKAPDASRVRRMIRRAEGTPPGPASQ